MVRYIYDAWGNHAVVNAAGQNIEDATHIGNKNPFRYNGYYYDVETDLYYLQTRYYDPEVGRFISQDSIDYADPETINGLNLYAYCGNNPAMNEDPTGHLSWKKFWKSVGKIAAAVAVVAVTAVVAVATAGTAIGVIAAGAAIGAAVGAVVGGASNAIDAALNGASGWDIFDAFAGGALSGSISGAASGALAASGFGIGYQVVGNALITGLENAVTSLISGEKLNPIDLAINVAVGGMAGFVGGRGVLNFDKKFGGIFLKSMLIKSGMKNIFKEVTLPIIKSGLVSLTGSVGKMTVWSIFK